MDDNELVRVLMKSPLIAIFFCEHLSSSCSLYTNLPHMSSLGLFISSRLLYEGFISIILNVLISLIISFCL